jgi:hypothetical protein
MMRYQEPRLISPKPGQYIVSSGGDGVPLVFEDFVGLAGRDCSVFLAERKVVVDFDSHAEAYIYGPQQHLHVSVYPSDRFPLTTS